MAFGCAGSTLSLSIEGFSEAATPAPLTIPWENVSGTKPTENADNTGENTSKDTGAVAGVPATQVIADAASVKQRSDTTDYVGRDSATNARVDQTAGAMSEGDRALGIRVDGVAASLATTDSAVRAEIGRVERTSVDRDTALGQRSDTITASLNDARGRLSTVETAVTDGRFAAAQRVSNLEARRWRLLN
ncbi:hypothetical protein [Sphingomonas sp. BK481]|uniref:hypothetical protein n=1 Tax=Sphingomonas sp. BK481 TaxID=2586981 RepID=UPI0016121ABB|nr:hypothetical protein [Sphingomonas sp. BK481]MBB3586012.1 hypothetical protein [Sphingomonas sp. BK481]